MEMIMKFKVGDVVECLDKCGWPLTAGKHYVVQSVTELYIRVVNDNGNTGGYSPTTFKLVVAANPVLTPEEVFEHLRKGTKLQCSDKGADNWCNIYSNRGVSVGQIIAFQWRIKPEPEVIELNGKRYKLIEE